MYKAIQKDYIKYIKCFLFILMMSLFISCSSAPPSDESQDSSVGGDLPEAAQINFDPSGSDSGSIAGLHSVHFDYDQATLTDEAKQRLNQNAEWIRQNDEVTLQIEGHCDQRGSLEYNLALGERRARVVKDYLTDMGLPAERLNTISFGEEKPLAEGDSESDHRQNRRANFVPLR